MMKTANQQREQLILIQKQLASIDHPISVLIVEDDLNDAALIHSKLKDCGIDSDVVPDGEAAIQMLSQREYYIIFLDWKLPGKSGRDTIMNIKKSFPNYIVIVLSGVATRDEMSEALSLGAAAVMPKPLGDEQIRLIFSKP